MEVLVSDLGRFEEYNPKESELEDFVVKTYKEIFGKDTCFVRLKKSLGRGKPRISYPDGYIIDLSDIENPTLFIVEVELSKHDPYKHIYVQITKHLNFFNENKQKVKKDLENAINEDANIKKFILNKIKGSKYSSIPDLIYDMVFMRPKSLAIIIDAIRDDLRTVVKNNISKFSDTKLIEFKTYCKTVNGKKKFIHRFKPLFEEVGEVEEDVRTWYKLVLEDLEFMQQSRSTFDKQHNISKYSQGFVYSKTTDAIIILWYKSNIDRHFEKEKKTYAATGRPLNVNKLKQGMSVYVVELQYDRNTGRRINDPKVRVHGKLKEVIKVDGDVETKVFPT